MTHNDIDRRETVHRAVRVLVVAWLAVMLLAAPAVAQTETATPTQTAPCAIGPPVPGQGADEPADGAGNLEVVMANDRTDSMSQDEIDAVVNGSTYLVDQLSETDESAAVSFAGGEASLDQELTTDHQATKDAITNALSTTEPTDTTAEGIETSHEELINGTNATQTAMKVMVLFSDDQLFGSDAFDAAQAAKDDGIRIFAIGLGDVPESDYEQIASSPDDAYFAPDSEDLDGIYQEITGEVDDIGTVDSELEVDTRLLYQPGATHPYTVNEITYLSDNTSESTDVTDGASVTTTNTTLLSVNESGHTLSATDDANTSTWVRVDATYNGTEGCTNVIVAEPTVENLQLIPGIWRFYAILDDSTMFALLIATLLSVPAARFTSAFGGLAVSEMVIVGFWFAGYIDYGFAAVSVFVAMFIGLNLAANIDYQVRR